jgi:hypothetical protein
MKTQLSKLKTIRLALGYMDDLATGIVGFVKKTGNTESLYEMDVLKTEVDEKIYRLEYKIAKSKDQNKVSEK